MWQPSDPETPIRIGISACLLGQQVRYNGGHCRDQYLTEVLGPFVQWVPVCPEVELGLGTPRETIQLVQLGDQIRLQTTATGVDLTERMRRFARRRVRQLKKEGLCGFILKRNSPSCGMERVKVHGGKGPPRRVGRGLFAEELMRAMPALPVEEEGRLNDAKLRENFIERIFAYHRLQQLFRPRWTIGQLVAFHTAHKLQLLAHHPQGYRQLGKLVAEAKRFSRVELRSQYELLFMDALRRIATVAKNVNVLQHMLGYFRQRLSAADRAELVSLIEDYRRGWVPLVTVITLMRHHVAAQGVEYLAGQTYLQPHPKELMLRNHV